MSIQTGVYLYAINNFIGTTVLGGALKIHNRTYTYTYIYTNYRNRMIIYM